MGAHVASVDGDVIHLAAGRYVEAPYITKSVAVVGAGADATTVDRNDPSCYCGPVFHIASGAVVSLSAITITNGTSRGHAGGAWGAAGIANFGRLTIEDCRIVDNISDHGAGIGNDAAAVLFVDRTTIVRNLAYHAGGGIENYGTATLRNSTVSGNRADEGAGIYNRGNLTLINSTVANNVADVGAGLDNFATLSVGHSIVAGNVAATGADCAGTITSLGHNLIGDSASCTITGDLTGNILDQLSYIGQLAGHGGPTETHVLLPWSPAIDAGDPVGCGLSVDQRQQPRGRDGDCDLLAVCDIGAYEADCPAGPVLYESPVSLGIVVRENGVELATTSPISREPAGALILFYAMDDGLGFPSVIFVVRDGLGLRVFF